eukprot:CAMPEP_0172384694 /NCGR_PEP_ID=MMETSP1061-20121228/2426_1 /TAXON_ID=37318 /ORGANISM="Pseudo-nitzschia pungens, Strain cf. pungens" /LENGTH=1064 /DNA_ID=CAMNT_0013113417 /DNA_START=385 /DNA_END=3579 /DNA_ORIENTATION=-
MLPRRLQMQQSHLASPVSLPSGSCSSTSPPRAVVTFYYNANNKNTTNGSDRRLRAEMETEIKIDIDLQDFEVLVETYKFLLTNHRKTLPKSLLRKQNKNQKQKQSSFHSHSHSNNNKKKKKKKSDLVVTELHKQAIVTLVEVDATSKRVMEILPEFFPISTRVLPVCLGKLDRLRCLRLEHCRELTGLPAGLELTGLEELRLNVTSLAEPLPASFGNCYNLTSLVLYGNCAGPRLVRSIGSSDDSSNTSNTSNSTDSDETQSQSQIQTEAVLFPPSMHRIHLKRLETHVQNLLHISPMVLDGWSSSVETLVVTQDLTSSSTLGGTSSSSHSARKKISAKPNEKQRQKQKQKQTPTQESFLRRHRSEEECEDEHSHLHLHLHLHPQLHLDSHSDPYSFDSDEFNLLGSSDDDLSSSSSEDETDFSLSLLKHGGGVFREALRNQVEERAFRSIARFENLKTLRLLFDDSKHRNDYKRKQKKTMTEDPYCVPLSLLAGPLSLTLRELDIGTCAANSGSNTSRIPIEVSWIDILCDFPLLQKLRLQDCSCSFVAAAKHDDSDNVNVNLTGSGGGSIDIYRQELLEENESPLLLPELRELVLDRCSNFALVANNKINNNNDNDDNDNDNDNKANTNTNKYAGLLDDVTVSVSKYQQLKQQQQLNQLQNRVQVLQHKADDYFLRNHNGSLQEIVFSGAGRSTDDEDEQDIIDAIIDSGYDFRYDDCGCYGDDCNCGCFDGEYEGPLEDCYDCYHDYDAAFTCASSTSNNLDEHDAISRIIRLTSLKAADALLSPAEQEDQLAILCFKFLSRCPTLVRLQLTGCQGGIPNGFCRDLLTCLPTDTLEELVLDAECEDREEFVRANLWAMVDAYPALAHLGGTYCTHGFCNFDVDINTDTDTDVDVDVVDKNMNMNMKMKMNNAEDEKLRKLLLQRQHRQRRQRQRHQRSNSLVSTIRRRIPWRVLFANQNSLQNNYYNNRRGAPLTLDATSASGLEQDARQAQIISMEMGQHQQEQQKQQPLKPNYLPLAPPGAAFRRLGQRLNGIRKNAGIGMGMGIARARVRNTSLPVRS